MNIKHNDVTHNQLNRRLVLFAFADSCSKYEAARLSRQYKLSIQDS